MSSSLRTLLPSSPSRSLLLVPSTVGGGAGARGAGRGATGGIRRRGRPPPPYSQPGVMVRHHGLKLGPLIAGAGRPPPLLALGAQGPLGLPRPRAAVERKTRKRDGRHPSCRPAPAPPRVRVLTRRLHGDVGPLRSSGGRPGRGDGGTRRLLTPTAASTGVDRTPATPRDAGPLDAEPVPIPTVTASQSQDARGA